MNISCTFPKRCVAVSAVVYQVDKLDTLFVASLGRSRASGDQRIWQTTTIFFLNYSQVIPEIDYILNTIRLLIQGLHHYLRFKYDSSKAVNDLHTKVSTSLLKRSMPQQACTHTLSTIITIAPDPVAAQAYHQTANLEAVYVDIVVSETLSDIE